MGFSLGGFLGGVAQGVGSYFGAKETADATRDANSENAKLSREQMAFQEKMAANAQNFSERMSSTAYQRGVADLKAAGLNPILAAGGGGASSPAGVSASGSLPNMQPVPSVMSGIISGAKDFVRLLQDLRESNSRIALNSEQASTTYKSGAESYERMQVATQNKLMLEKQNEILEKELNFRRKHPALTGAADVLNRYAPLMHVGSSALSIIR